MGKNKRIVKFFYSFHFFAIILLYTPPPPYFSLSTSSLTFSLSLSLSLHMHDTVGDSKEKILIALRNFTNRACGLKQSNTSFPGGMPLSLQRKDIPVIFGEEKKSHHEYTLGLKADGINSGRFFLGFLCVGHAFVAYTVDRQFTHTILTQYPVSYLDLFEGSLFDMEHMCNKNTRHFTFLLFDTIYIHGNSVVKEHYLTRLEVARHSLDLQFKHRPEARNMIVPRSEYAYPSKYPDRILDIFSTIQNDANNITTKLRVKEVYYTIYLHRLLGPGGQQYQQEQQPQESRIDIDGAVWTSTTSPYALFTQQPKALLKWKPLHTIDFLVVPNPNRNMGWHKIENIPDTFRVRTGSCALLTTHNNNPILFAMADCFDQKVVEGIYECSWDAVALRWVLLQRRVDKPKPNQLLTVARTVINIVDFITLSDIINAYK